MDKLTFPNQSPLPDLIDPVVNSETVRQAIEAWIANPPDADFTNILTAEPDS